MRFVIPVNGSLQGLGSEQILFKQLWNLCYFKYLCSPKISKVKN